MKNKPGMIILAVALAGLAVVWVATKHRADHQLQVETNAALGFSNQLVMARAHLDELGQANLLLTNDLIARWQEALSLSNQCAEAAAALSTTRVSLQNAQQQIAGLNQRVSGLGARNQVLDQRVAALAGAMDNLNVQIAATRHRLADSETNNTFLEKELQRQTAARSQLESKFNDLTAVRAQAKKLKEDQIVGRRLEWMRDGTEPTRDVKGGQHLVQLAGPPPDLPPRYDLNAEIGSDGAIRVMPTASADSP